MRILLIEDDATIAEFVQHGLEQSGYQVVLSNNGRDGLALALTESFDLGVFDIMLPQLDGLSVIAQIRQRGLKLPIIILSAKRSIDDRVNGLHQGSDDYLVKPFSFSELLARVQALLRRSNQELEATTISMADLTIDLLARTAVRGQTKICLQPKEFTLLEYLMRNQGRVVSKTMIMERVWNYNFDPHTNVVEARMSKLREKIDKGFERPLIHTIRGLGYVMRAND